MAPFYNVFTLETTLKKYAHGKLEVVKPNCVSDVRSPGQGRGVLSSLQIEVRDTLPVGQSHFLVGSRTVI